MAGDRDAELNKMREILNDMGKDRTVFSKEGAAEVAAHGINVSEYGKEMPVEEIAKQDDIVYVAGTVANTHAWVNGAKGGYFCAVCGVELLLSPSSQAIEANGAKFICINCAHIKWQEDNRGSS